MSKWMIRNHPITILILWSFVISIIGGILAQTISAHDLISQGAWSFKSISGPKPMHRIGPRSRGSSAIRTPTTLRSAIWSHACTIPIAPAIWSIAKVGSAFRPSTWCSWIRSTSSKGHIPGHLTSFGAVFAAFGLRISFILAAGSLL